VTRLEVRFQIGHQQLNLESARLGLHAGANIRFADSSDLAASIQTVSGSIAQRQYDHGHRSYDSLKGTQKCDDLLLLLSA
jgi:hypothetical protein